MASEPPTDGDEPVTVIRWKKWETILRVLVYLAMLVGFAWAMFTYGQPIIP